MTSARGRSVRVTKALSWISLQLIRHNHGYVVYLYETKQLMQALVKLLLAIS
jgi:hypothetical protein